jgi:hypothetical protein
LIPSSEIFGVGLLSSVGDSKDEPTTEGAEVMQIQDVVYGLAI